MIIDTYVYFVSYTIHSKKYRPANTNIELIWDNKIGSISDIKEMEELIKKEGKPTLNDDDIEFIKIINFQLLDSYNKEEREASIERIKGDNEINGNTE
jgi:hypothetical protein